MLNPSHPLWRHLRLPFALRLFLLYFAFVGLTGYLVLSVLAEQIKPGFRQASEESLIDASQHLADLVAPHLSQGRLTNPQVEQMLRQYGQRSARPELWGLQRTPPDHRIYLTDELGIVLFDSKDLALGADYSRWNDVHRTLRGQYGARSSPASDEPGAPTVMHVAAPVRAADGQIIGVLTLAKSNRSLQPFIDRSERYLLERGMALMLLGLLLGGLLTWRLQSGLNRLRLYIRGLHAGLRLAPPKFRLFFEFGDLATALDTFRAKLEGKALRDEALQTLTHELKSPLTAIRAATEILANPLPEADRQKFLGHIRNESDRLNRLSEQLLAVSALEQLPHLPQPVPVALDLLVRQLLDTNSARLATMQVQLQLELTPQQLAGDATLLRQALQHLLDNALDFMPSGGWLRLTLQQQQQKLCLQLANQGPQIPDYALARLGEKFFSMPRPAGSANAGRKSTGLGLCFVRQVLALHQGDMQFENLPDGVQVSIWLPSL